MMTENLQDMVSGINGKPAYDMRSEYDILLGHLDKEDVLANSKPGSLPVQELQVMEKSEPLVSQIQSMTTIKAPEAELVSEYHPESEEALIDYVNCQNSKLEMANILVKWEIGRCINSFYLGKYGTNELGKISAATGVGRDTLAKACKFAKQYSKEHVGMLLKGNFPISWTLIAPHLTVEPQKVVDIYQVSPDPKQFYRIIKLKSPCEARGKSKPPKIEEAKPIEHPSYCSSCDHSPKIRHC